MIYNYSNRSKIVVKECWESKNLAKIFYTGRPTKFLCYTFSEYENLAKVYSPLKTEMNFSVITRGNLSSDFFRILIHINFEKTFMNSSYQQIVFSGNNFTLCKNTKEKK